MSGTPLDPSERDLEREYRFDYARAKPNRFAPPPDRKQVLVTLDEDVARAFPTAEAVNEALRGLIDRDQI